VELYLHSLNTLSWCGAQKKKVTVLNTNSCTVYYSEEIFCCEVPTQKLLHYIYSPTQLTECSPPRIFLEELVTARKSNFAPER
jgi:hypothetical protein